MELDSTVQLDTRGYFYYLNLYVNEEEHKKIDFVDTIYCVAQAQELIEPLDHTIFMSINLAMNANIAYVKVIKGEKNVTG